MKKRYRLVLYTLAIGFIVGLFLQSWFWGSFIDEHENFLGGWLLAKGWVPYKDFFSHHAPLPYFVSSLFFPWVQGKWWLFRIITLGYWFFSGLIIWRVAGKKYRSSLILTGMILAITVPKLNLQMFLAESFVVPSLLASVVLLLAYWQQQLKFPQALKWLLGFFFVSGWSTVAAVPLFLVLVGVLFIKEYLVKKSLSDIYQISRKPLSWFLFLNSVFPFYFFASGAWRDFWWSVIDYNTHYYFPARLAATVSEKQGGALYTAYTRFFSLITEIILLMGEVFWTFLLTAKGVLLSIGRLSTVDWWDLFRVWLSHPFEILGADIFTVLAVVWWGVIINFAGKKRWLLVAALVAGSGLLYVRNNEAFHTAMLFAVLLWVLAMSLTAVFQQQRQKTTQLIFVALLFLLVIKHFGPRYLEHRQNKSGIIFPEVQQRAKVISEKTLPLEKIQVIGGETAYYFLSDRLPASRYSFYFPWLAVVPEIQQELRATINQRAAAMVVIESYFYENQPPVDPELVQLVMSSYHQLEKGLYQ